VTPIHIGYYDDTVIRTTWAWVGLGCALLGSYLALLRSKASARSFYEQEVYDMTPTSHRRFAQASLGFAAFFAISTLTPKIPAIPVLAMYTLILILYAATFVRGATGEDD
jgi:hypothetical protein